MNIDEIEIGNVIMHDLQCINTSKLKGDDKYHYELAVGNLKDLLKGKYRKKVEV